ncbi:HipA domain-containing protein [Brevundimonas lutea]|uniref:HipA domain-containing protein n=1 Tax=Brevundimonas lutea TaxID=2293980 RepID=UPI0013CF10CB|nr:HipA domain-containing protein [Brevundimonas lutea]
MVSLADWRQHDDFYPFAPGTKPKGLLWCPEHMNVEFLLPGHIYMFKTGDDWRARQFWSEVIAYELSKVCGVYVPPAFVATGPDGATTGCIHELFHGYRDQAGEARLIHGADLLRRITPNFDDKTGRPHTYTANVRICRAYGVAYVIENWAALFAFDALIGNTDRHPENWGLLRQLEDDTSRLVFAPLYDNGTSLGYSVREEHLERELAQDRIERFINRGTHHAQFAADDVRGARHVDLCRQFSAEYPAARDVMARVTNFDPKEVADILGWCTTFEVEPRFTRQRAAYVAQLIESRRQAIIAALEG